MLDRLSGIGCDVRETTGRVTALPANAQEAGEVVRLAAVEKWLVAPHWMELPVRGREVVFVSAERMADVPEVSPADLLAVAGAGATVGTLSERGDGAGLCWPVAELVPSDAMLGDVFARLSGSWTLEGNLARRYLLTVEAVMADGALLRTGARTVKSVTGYDLRQLLIGSRGTLGIITRLTLRLEARANLEMVMGRYRADFAGLTGERDGAGAAPPSADGSYRVLEKLKAQLDPAGVFPSVDDAFCSV
jgi:FAD/FMN-containing dehydrogenase